MPEYQLTDPTSACGGKPFCYCRCHCLAATVLTVILWIVVTLHLQQAEGWKNYQNLEHEVDYDFCHQLDITEYVMYVCVPVCVCVCLPAYMCLHACVCMRACIYTYLHLWVCVHIHICIHISTISSCVMCACMHIIRLLWYQQGKQVALLYAAVTLGHEQHKRTCSCINTSSSIA